MASHWLKKLSTLRLHNQNERLRFHWWNETLRLHQFNKLYCSCVSRCALVESVSSDFHKIITKLDVRLHCYRAIEKVKKRRTKHDKSASSPAIVCLECPTWAKHSRSVHMFLVHDIPSYQIVVLFFPIQKYTTALTLEFRPNAYKVGC